jgi:hypothetical protein
MAKFIEIKSSGSGLAGGNILINADEVLLVAAASATTTTLTMSSASTGGDIITVTHGSVGTTPSVRDAINAALTAKPGGVKAKVQLPTGITVTGIAIA